MLVSCPSCATRHDLPQARLADGGMIRCAACGHGWIESRAIEIVEVAPRSLAPVIEHSDEPEREIQRLVEASREAQEEFAAARRRRKARLQRWAGFVACLCVPFVLAFSLPEPIVKAAPAAIGLYRAAGIEVNIYGLELRNVRPQHMRLDGTRVIAVKGEIVNVSDTIRKIPSLRFGLGDAARKEVYHWLLDTGARPLRPGEATGFVTRLASPPEAAKSLEIRFARAHEIGSNAAP